jgi:hypothetical protein
MDLLLKQQNWFLPLLKQQKEFYLGLTTTPETAEQLPLRNHSAYHRAVTRSFRTQRSSAAIIHNYKHISKTTVLKDRVLLY